MPLRKSRQGIEHGSALLFTRLIRSETSPHGRGAIRRHAHAETHASVPQCRSARCTRDDVQTRPQRDGDWVSCPEGIQRALNATGPDEYQNGGQQSAVDYSRLER